MFQAHQIDIEEQHEKARQRIMNQIPTYKLKEKTGNVYYQETQTCAIYIRYKQSEKVMRQNDRSSSSHQNTDLGRIHFYYVIYKYDGVVMPLAYGVSLTVKEFTNYWGFFDTVPLFQIFTYIKDKQCFTFFLQNNAYLKLTFEVQFNNKISKKEIKVNLNKIDKQDNGICKMYVKHLDKIANYKMEALMKKLIQLEAYKNSNQKKQIDQMPKSEAILSTSSFSCLLSKQEVDTRKDEDEDEEEEVGVEKEELWEAIIKQPGEEIENEQKQTTKTKRKKKRMKKKRVDR